MFSYTYCQFTLQNKWTMAELQVDCVYKVFMKT